MPTIFWKEPNFLSSTASIYKDGGRKLSKAEFDEVLEKTIFSPCPMGNAILETWRLYESLKLGCISIVENRAALDYFTNLFGPHPIPSFRSWETARQYVQTALIDKLSLHLKQSEIRGWWAAKKWEVRRRGGNRSIASCRIGKIWGSGPQPLSHCMSLYVWRSFCVIKRSFCVIKMAPA